MNAMKIRIKRFELPKRNAEEILSLLRSLLAEGINALSDWYLLIINCEKGLRVLGIYISHFVRLMLILGSFYSFVTKYYENIPYRVE